MRALKLLALVEKPLDRAPHQRFRLEQWAPRLRRDHAIDLDFSPFETDALADLMDHPGARVRKFALAAAATVRRWLHRSDARAYDGVVIQRSASLLGGAWYERSLNTAGIPYLFDFDDAIWEPAPGWTRHVWRSHVRVPESIRRATAVTPGNEYLAAFARRFNEVVTVVPTSIDLDDYPRQPQRVPSAPFRILWIGSAATLPYLDMIMPALARLATHVNFSLHVVYNGPPREHVGLDVEYTRWTPDGEVPALADCDVGIMPLPDTPFARGKCGLKALQYMAVERATVVSPVGVNRDIVSDGANGLWASNPDEWVDRLAQLAANPPLRAQLAAAGRRTVEHRYSATVAAATFASVARSALRPATPRE